MMGVDNAITQDLLQDITDGGERVVHLQPHNGYIAHLSLYRFALGCCQGKHVLDAGSGTGYGAHFLASHGAEEVIGVDVSAKAVAFSQEHFSLPNLRYQVLDLYSLAIFADNTFDVIFSSNTLEHLADVASFLREACRVLRPDGVLIVAVLPIIHEPSRRDNINNPWHLNIWTPAQWQHVLGYYFGEIQGHRHQIDGPEPLNLLFGDGGLTPEQFLFPPFSAAEMTQHGTITAIFVAKFPQKYQLLPPWLSFTFIDDSFSRPAPLSDPSVRPSAPAHQRWSAAQKLAWILKTKGVAGLAFEIQRFCAYYLHKFRSI